MANQNTIADLSVTPASNLNVLGQSQQGTAPASTIDNIFQRYGAILARAYADMGGTGTVGGTANAITLTTASTYQALTNGLLVAFKATADNSAATTINVDTLGAKAIRTQGDIALAGGEIKNKGTYLLRYDTAYNTTGAWVLINAGGGSAATTSAQGIVALNYFGIAQNIGLAASVGSSALTVALKGADGNDPSATNPVIIPFRNVTAATGTPSFLTVTAATSIVISSGSTMGFTSGVAGRLWIVGFNDGSTFRMGLVNCLSSTSIMALRDGIYSSTAEGGAGAADSAQVIYTDTAVTSKAMTILGYIEATEATAGTWATAPSLIKILQPGDPLPGDTVQWQANETGAVASGSTAIPLDDTIPQITEGDQYLSQAITPTSAANVLRTSVIGVLTNGTNTVTCSALFRDSTANAVSAMRASVNSAGHPVGHKIIHSEIAGSTAATTFKWRGGAVSGTTTFNGISGARTFGGALGSMMQVEEIMA